MGNMFNLLRGTCMFCHRFKLSRTVVRTIESHLLQILLNSFLKLWKYLAKLRLLERGLLDAAQGVDDMQLRIQRNKDGEEEELSRETPQAFIARINLYVAIHLARAPNNTRDSHKDALIYQARKDLIHEFLKFCIQKKCQNSDCGW